VAQFFRRPTVNLITSRMPSTRAWNAAVHGTGTTKLELARQIGTSEGAGVPAAALRSSLAHRTLERLGSRLELSLRQAA
jgi:hypothetical protein